MSSVRRSILAVAVGWGVTACGPDPSAGDAKPSTALPADAPESVALPSCGIGTMPGAGRTCTPVGTRDVPKGFERRRDDWGFRAIAAWGECAPLTFSAIGSGRCLVVDPCDAAFPPAGVDRVVHDQSELTAALAAAASGETIALDEGTYQPIVLERDVNLVGRCPEKVVFLGTGEAAKQNGIGLEGAHAVSVRSVSFQNLAFGVWVGGDGASLSVERSIFTDNGAAAWVTSGAKLDFRDDLVLGQTQTMADGVLVAHGGHAEVAGSELRNMHIALQAFGAGSTARGSALVVSDWQDRVSEPMAALIVASEGGHVEVDRSMVFSTKIFVGGATATDPRDEGRVPATLRFTNSDLLRVHPTEAGGFDVSGGSTLELDNVTFETRARVAVSAEDGANVSLARTVVRPVLPTDPADRGVGAGLVVNDDARVSIEDSAIMGVAQSAIAASKGCRIRMTHSLVKDVWEFERKDFETRMHSGQAISLSGTASLEMTDSTLQDNAGVAIWADRGGASLAVDRSAIVDTRSPEASNSIAGIVAWAGTIDVSDSLVHGMPSTAIAVGDAVGAVSKTVLSKSDVAFRWLGESRLVTSSDETRRPADGEIVSRDNVVVDARASESDEGLDLGDCRCGDAKK